MQVSDNVTVVREVKSGKAKNGNEWAQFNVVSNFYSNGKTQKTFKVVKCWDYTAKFAQKLKPGNRIKIMGLLVQEDYNDKKYEYILASFLQFDQNASAPKKDRNETQTQVEDEEPELEVETEEEVEDTEEVPF